MASFGFICRISEVSKEVGLRFALQRNVIKQRVVRVMISLFMDRGLTWVELELIWS